MGVGGRLFDSSPSCKGKQLGFGDGSTVVVVSPRRARRRAGCWAVRLPDEPPPQDRNRSPRRPGTSSVTWAPQLLRVADPAEDLARPPIAPMDSKTSRPRSRQSVNSGSERTPVWRPPLTSTSNNCTGDPWSGYGSGRRSTASTTLKIAQKVGAILDRRRRRVRNLYTDFGHPRSACAPQAP